MSKIVRLPSVLIGAALFAALLAGTAFACREESRAAIKSYVVPRPVFAARHTRQADRITTGSIDKKELTEEEHKRVSDCMAIWDKGTHMTKVQWRRTCVSLLGDY